MNFCYGHVVGILSINDEEYYIPLIVKEGTGVHPTRNTHYIPMADTVEHLATMYGEPQALIGLRVRVEYWGRDWRNGACRIEAGRTRRAAGPAATVETTGFRWAVAGGGVI